MIFWDVLLLKGNSIESVILPRPCLHFFFTGRVGRRATFCIFHFGINAGVVVFMPMSFLWFYSFFVCLNVFFFFLIFTSVRTYGNPCSAFFLRTCCVSLNTVWQVSKVIISFCIPGYVFLLGVPMEINEILYLRPFECFTTTLCLLSKTFDLFRVAFFVLAFLHGNCLPTKDNICSGLFATGCHDFYTKNVFL